VVRRRIGSDVIAEAIVVTGLAISPVDGAIHAELRPTAFSPPPTRD
jgi:hypothetical protein